MKESTAEDADYQAAQTGAAVAVSQGRRFVRVRGREPGAMLAGLITNSPPPPLAVHPDGGQVGRVVYSALLTAKGRMITDLRVYTHPEEGFILDLPSTGLPGALEHFRRFLPPRLAGTDDASGHLNLFDLLGPGIPPLLSDALEGLGVSVPPARMEAAEEGAEIVFPLPAGGVVRLAGSGETHTWGWRLLVPSGQAAGLLDRLHAGGAVPLTESTLDTLRVEKGRPAFGKDMNEETIPVEAGIQNRAIDYEKGCYTGQEVIIRIRDRGQVNKMLMGLLLGTTPRPEPGTRLYEGVREKEVGWVTSSVLSPALGQTLALGYVKRGVGPGDTVRIGAPDGPEGGVRVLTDDGWILD
jgi:aminomethyltransferase